MTIPNDWEYIRTGIFFLKKLPVAWICSDYGPLQCLCPYCSYGDGYNKPIIAGFTVKKVVVCHKCNTKFMALVNKGKKVS